ncbi:MAG: rod shape-determining protein MreC [Bradymonadia bacterium]|jgi:rod shape-determining protein MreC
MFDLLQRNRGPIVFGLYIAIALVLVLVERRGDQRMGVAGSATMQAMSFSQGVANQSLGGIGDWWSRYVDVVGVAEENERLRGELNRLRDENTRLLGVMQENARLRAMLGFEESHPQLELVPARVVGVDTSPFFRVVSIQLRNRDGRLELGMPVVSSAGVVGHISELAGRDAIVTLAVDPRSSVDVLLQRNRARGVLKGLGHEADYQASISYLLRRDRARPGDLVVTSGMGGRFPPDLLVGRVLGIDNATAGMFQSVVVEPAVDFSRLEEVYVIVGTRR